MEKSSDFYDDVFRQQEMYARSFKDSPYYVLWTQIIYSIKKLKSLKILEMGCGPGQFASYLKEEGFKNYVGFDFSEEAVKVARNSNPGLHFFLGNVFDQSIYSKYEYDTAICLEVLEHLEEDRKVVKLIPEGKTVVLSVPDFDSESHVRWFRSERQVKSRYFDLIDVSLITKVNHWYLLVGKRNSIRPNIIQLILKSRENIGFSSFSSRLRFHIKNKLKLKWIK